MNSSTRNEIELRAELLRRKYDERTLRNMFADRSHESEFAAIGRPMFAGRIAVPDHMLVWTGFEVAVFSLMMSEELVGGVAEAVKGRPDASSEELHARASV